MGSPQNHTLIHVAITGTDKRGPIQMNPIHSLIFRRPTNQERAFLPPAGHLDRQMVCICLSKDKSDGQDRSASTFAID